MKLLKKHNQLIIWIIFLVVTAGVFGLVMCNLINFNTIQISFKISSVRAAGNNYYVATTGSDANNGSEAAPWKTI